ncbi:MAG: lytic transglycosylase [Alphaproteobacteria bacterium]|nr:MAG: lytic transglycosylase [Alphaproteobacteria bacterium]
MIKTLAFATLLLAGAAHAEVADPGDTVLTVTANRPGITARQRAVPPQLSLADRAAYRQIFLDIEAGRTSAAEAGLSNIGNGLLTETARAQLMIVRGSTGKLSRSELATWLQAYRDLPQAQRIAQMAARLPGADTAPLPLLPTVRPFRTVSYAVAPNDAGPIDLSTGGAIKVLLAADRNAEAEARWLADAGSLSPGARSQWAQRIAWSYYGNNDNVAALRLAQEAAKASHYGNGQYPALGAWVAGLAAFRTGQYDLAARSFDQVLTKGPGSDLAAAAHYWASRAYLAAGQAELVAERLEAAAKTPNNFYGLLARRTLGLPAVQDWNEPDFITADWNHLKTIAGAKRAAALIEIGQIGLGDRELRHLAQTAPDADYPALLRLAARLGLPATQYQLAVRPPVGIEAPLSARYPAPDWVPARGWRVDRGLVFAHALQESTFITTATSRAGAKGLMQLMPGTARQVKAEMTEAAMAQGSAFVVGDLADPAFNIEVGQTYLEALRDMSYTQGLLPKVVAAYNAGPGSVQRWNAKLDDRGDPLLFIESIPFKETRHYVEVVLRNYWMYQLRDGVKPASMDALAANMWPKFPGMPGAAGIKMAPRPLMAPTTVPTPLAPGSVPPQLKLDEDDQVTVTAGLSQ